MSVPRYPVGPEVGPAPAARPDFPPWGSQWRRETCRVSLHQLRSGQLQLHQLPPDSWHSRLWTWSGSCRAVSGPGPACCIWWPASGIWWSLSNLQQWPGSCPPQCHILPCTPDLSQSGSNYSFLTQVSRWDWSWPGRFRRVWVIQKSPWSHWSAFLPAAGIPPQPSRRRGSSCPEGDPGVPSPRQTTEGRRRSRRLHLRPAGVAGAEAGWPGYTADLLPGEKTPPAGQSDCPPRHRSRSPGRGRSSYSPSSRTPPAPPGLTEAGGSGSPQYSPAKLVKSVCDEEYWQGSLTWAREHNPPSASKAKAPQWWLWLQDNPQRTWLGNTWGGPSLVMLFSQEEGLRVETN